MNGQNNIGSAGGKGMDDTKNTKQPVAGLWRLMIEYPVLLDEPVDPIWFLREIVVRPIAMPGVLLTAGMVALGQCVGKVVQRLQEACSGKKRK